MPGGNKKGGGLKTKSYSPYKMKGSPMYRNFGVGTPPKGTAGGDSPVSGDSPAKGWFKNAMKKVGGGIKKFAKGEGALGLLNPIGRGISELTKKRGGGGGGGGEGGDLEARVAALEEGASGGGEAQATMMEGADPAVAKKQQILNERAGIPTMPTGFMSDIRAKEKIERTGESLSGIPTYEFNYIGDNNRYSGAMAQDLLEMNIDAVSMGDDGFYRVNYNNIDVDMRLIN